MVRAARQRSPHHNDAFGRARDRLIAAFRAQTPTRAGSLLISVFGDAIAPHGGTVWLGSLIDAMKPFGISQRAVRTAVFRLVRDGWLENEQIGRRSYYRLTRDGRHRFAAAARRIYAEPRQSWNERWQMVLLGGVESTRREQVRRELGWLGFAPFSANLMAHPSADVDAVRKLLEELHPDDRALLMEARVDESSEDYLKTLVSQAWSLDDLGARYRRFLDDFRPVLQALGRSRAAEPATAFQVRVLLVHEYRKILLRDPQLPEDLLPPTWDGVSAFQLARNVYAKIAGAAQTYLTTAMVSADGPLPPPEPAYFDRFGGLPDGGR